MKWCDAVGKTLYTGDWVAYLIPNARRLTMGPVMRGTASSVTVLEIAGSNRESSGAKWDLETTISRPFNIVVKIETPWDFIEKSLDQRSGFCAGIDLARKELQAMVLTNTHHTFDTFDLDDDAVGAYVDKEFPQQSFVGAHWYNTPNFLETREQMIEIVRGGFNWYKKTNWDVF